LNGLTMASIFFIPRTCLWVAAVGTFSRVHRELDGALAGQVPTHKHRCDRQNSDDSTMKLTKPLSSAVTPTKERLWRFAQAAIFRARQEILNTQRFET
jgi:hypothetical protein